MMTGAEKKKLRVAGAVIIREGKLFAARRAYSPYSYLIHKLELPGGKLEAGEIPSDCVTRELKEELDWTVEPIKELPSYFFEYPDFDITLYPVLCTAEGEPIPKEHEELTWIPIDKLDETDWAPADGEFLSDLKKSPRIFIDSDQA